MLCLQQTFKNIIIIAASTQGTKVHRVRDSTRRVQLKSRDAGPHDRPRGLEPAVSLGVAP